jgi:hypothetical protein
MVLFERRGIFMDLKNVISGTDILEELKEYFKKYEKMEV